MAYARSFQERGLGRARAEAAQRERLQSHLATDTMLRANYTSEYAALAGNSVILALRDHHAANSDPPFVCLGNERAGAVFFFFFFFFWLVGWLVADRPRDITLI